MADSLLQSAFLVARGLRLWEYAERGKNPGVCWTCG